MYRLTGEYPAGLFFKVNETNGHVSIVNPPKSDSHGNMEYRVRLFDYSQDLNLVWFNGKKSLVTHSNQSIHLIHS